MEEASEQQRKWNKEMSVTTNLSLDIDKSFPRNLLQDFMSGDRRSVCDEESEIELNLGLSLGGKFGVDKTQRKLKRSSSVLDSVPEDYSVGLARTTSLPAEIKEEWWKRKDKTSKCYDDETVSLGSERWVTASKSGVLQRHFVSTNGKLCVDSNGGGGGGGSSSSLSELDNRNQQGSSNSCGEEISPKVMTGSSNKANEYETEKQVRREESEHVDRKGKGMAMSTGLFDMPCVFTKGDGPNGRRVDGILYKYAKGEQVRIMCICHGTFLTPAEFVKHGGGGDVDRPLRHIVVNTSSSTF